MGIITLVCLILLFMTTNYAVSGIFFGDFAGTRDGIGFSNPAEVIGWDWEGVKRLRGGSGIWFWEILTSLHVRVAAH